MGPYSETLSGSGGTIALILRPPFPAPPRPAEPKKVGPVIIDPGDQ